MGFVNAEVIDVSSGDIICMATHTKFMQMGLQFQLFMGPLFPLVKWISSLRSNKTAFDASVEAEANNVNDLLQLYELENDAAKYQFSSDHRHMNPAGVVHGGCQAMLMELSGHPEAAKALDNFSPQLQSFSISFVSAAKGAVTIDLDWLCRTNSDGTMKVVMRRAGNNQMVSEAFLKWGEYSPTKDKDI